MKNPFEEAINQIQGQIELDEAELKEWTPEYADYRQEHRDRIRNLRLSIAALRALGDISGNELEELLNSPASTFPGFARVAKRLLRARRAQERRGK